MPRKNEVARAPAETGARASVAKAVVERRKRSTAKKLPVPPRRTGELVDCGAAEIGAEFEAASRAIVNSVERLIECGKKLQQQKDLLGHGRWHLWLDENATVLGFGVRTAERLLKLAKTTATSHLDPAMALAASRQAWGNDRPAPAARRIEPPSRSAWARPTPEQIERERERPEPEPVIEPEPDEAEHEHEADAEHVIEHEPEAQPATHEVEREPCQPTSSVNPISAAAMAERLIEDADSLIAAAAKHPDAFAGVITRTAERLTMKAAIMTEVAQRSTGALH